ncbi:transposable element tc3 transposase, partial [Aspergillus sclerotialis]
WILKHRLDQRFSIHNHEPSRHPSAHPIHRQLSGGTTQLASFSNAGIAPKEIQTLIRQSGSLATRQDVYNRIASVRRDLCEGQSPIHALANQLDKEGFWSRIQFAPDGHVTAVLFAHPDSLTYLQAYPELLLLDCTYKTNKYGMPLLDIIGVDATQRSFCIAFAFLSNETEDDYIWALDRLKSLYKQCNAALPSVILTDRCLALINAASTLFPSTTILLCLWHVNKAVLARCQPTFSDTEKWTEFYGFWHSIINSPTKEVYTTRLKEFQQKYAPEHLEEVAYIKTTWLIPFKEKLVKAWVDQSTHFGNTATSRVEGIHALLKSYLRRSTFDLFEAWKAIQLALLNQLSELKSNQAKQQLRIPLELSGALYGA